MTTRTRRKYDRKFKIEAVKLVTERGTSIAEEARNLGIHENLLRTWEKSTWRTQQIVFQAKVKI